MEVNREIYNNNFNEIKVRNCYFNFLKKLAKFGIDPINNIYTQDNIQLFNNE